MTHHRSANSHPSRPASLCASTRPGPTRPGPTRLSLDDKAIYAGVLITRAQMIAQCRAIGLPETGFGVDWFAFGPPFERHRIADDDLTREQFPFGLLVYVSPNEQEIRILPARAAAAEPNPTAASANPTSNVAHVAHVAHVTPEDDQDDQDDHPA